MDKIVGVFDGPELGSGPTPAHELDKAGTTDLFNTKVDSVQKVQRDLDSSGGGSAAMTGLQHEAVKVNLADGREYLGNQNKADCGSGGALVFTDAKTMSSAWKPVGEPVKPADTKLGDLKEAGGSGRYNLLTNNCIQASNKMMDAAKDKQN